MKMRKNKTKPVPSNAPVALVLFTALILFGEAVGTEAKVIIVYRDAPAPLSATGTPATPEILPVAEPEPRKATHVPPKRVQASLKAPPQAIKDATASVCRRVGENRQAILSGNGVSAEAFASTCYYDLLAMAYAESRFNCEAVGDGGRSRGCFQIQTALHGVSVADAERYEFAAEWTVDRMVRDLAYPTYRTAAITRHNGAGEMAARYAASVKATAEKFESQGL